MNLKNYLTTFIYWLNKIFFLTEIERSTRFDILDGFRGILAITVVIQHTIAIFHLGGDYVFFDGTGYYVGVVSFFILSAFLLTYKMFNQFCKSNGNYREMILIVIKYFIRRFFRIYIPYVAFCIYAKLNLTYSTRFGLWYESMFNLLTLKSVGANHLGTIPPEVKYYFFIPVFSFVTFKLKRFIFIWIAIIILVIYLIDQYNLFDLNSYFFRFLVGKEYSMPFIFFIFLFGSLLGILFHKLQKINSSEFRILDFLHYFVSFILFGMVLYGAKHNSNYYFRNNYQFTTQYQFRYSIYWTIFILFLLLEKKSKFSEVMNLTILKKCGEYSFGIYLMHHDALAGVKYLNQKNFMNKTGLEIITLALILSYFCGMCFYHFIEVPSMNVGNYVIDKISSSKCFKRPIVTDALEPLIPISLTDEELK